MYKICRTERSYFRQRQLEEGMLSYMETTFYFEMEIAGLCRHLEVPRKTFYRYFGSKEDALYAIVDHRLEDMRRYIGDSNHSLHDDVRRYFEFWKKQKAFLDVLDRNYLLSVIMMRSTEYSGLKTFPELYEFDQPVNERDYRESFLIAGMMSMMIRWYKDGCLKSPEEMAEIAGSLMEAPLRNLMNYEE